MKKIINYFKGVREELTKVVWPTRREAFRLTIVVVALAGIFGTFVGSLDYTFTYLLEKILIK